MRCCLRCCRLVMFFVGRCRLVMFFVGRCRHVVVVMLRWGSFALQHGKNTPGPDTARIHRLIALS